MGCILHMVRKELMEQACVRKPFGKDIKPPTVESKALEVLTEENIQE